MSLPTFELKRANVSSQGTFSGLAAVFGIRDRQGDVIEAGAFRGAIQFLKAQGASLPLLWDHKQDTPIGVINSMTETDDGLFVEGALFLEQPQAKVAYDLMKSAAASMSIGYNIKQSAPLEGGRRRLLDLDLGEVSIVSVAASPLARVTAVKSEILESAPAFEKACRELLGLSNREAKRLARGGFAALTKSDEPEPEDLAVIADQIKSISRILRT